MMACITSPTYSLLINGSASPFFHVERGLRQGCPFSPLLFLLVMEELSRLIHHEKQNGILSGLNIIDQCFLTHLLFIDNVIIFFYGSVRDSTTFDKILASFFKATGMMANHTKSTISQVFTSAQESELALQRFPYNPQPLDQGFKYLGYWIKLTSHKIADWTWLITKLENWISHRSHHFLSSAGRLVLIKSVLEATPVF